MAALRNMASTCDFGTFLNEALRDRFICGIRDEATKRKLISTRNLTVTTALDTALADEQAKNQISALKSHDAAPKSVNKLQAKSEKPGKANSSDQKECFRCGNKSHLANQCPFRNAECFRCKRVGH
jgi:hypothetical protein